MCLLKWSFLSASFFTLPHYVFLIGCSKLWCKSKNECVSKMLCSPSSRVLIASRSQGKAIFSLTPQGKMVIASGTTCEFIKTHHLSVNVDSFGQPDIFLALWQAVRAFTLSVLQYGMWICMPVLNSLISLLMLFYFIHMILFCGFALSLTLCCLCLLHALFIRSDLASFSQRT